MALIDALAPMIVAIQRSQQLQQRLSAPNCRVAAFELGRACLAQSQLNAQAIGRNTWSLERTTVELVGAIVEDFEALVAIAGEGMVALINANAVVSAWVIRAVVSEVWDAVPVHPVCPPPSVAI
jgi:hypothetical protein